MSAPEFSSNDVARYAHVSLRQLQWWDERGLISPRIDGHRRIYSERDARDARIIADFRRRGVSLQAVRNVMPKVRRHIGERLIDGEGLCYVVTDGHAVHIEIHPQRIIEIVRDSMVPMIVLEVRAEIEIEMPKRKGRAA